MMKYVPTKSLLILWMIHIKNIKLLQMLQYQHAEKNTCSLFLWENTIPGGINIKKFNPEMWIRLSEDDINHKINSFNCSIKVKLKNINNIDDHILNRVNLG